MGKRKVCAEDIFRISLIGDAQMHPDGQSVAVTVTRLDAEENLYQSHIWLVQTSSGECIPFTASEKSESAPQWSPDGKWLAFLSNRTGDKQQVFVMGVNGGEARQVTNAADGVQSFRWSPDGRGIAFVSQTIAWAKDEPSSGASLEPKSPREKFTTHIEVIRRTGYRLDGVGTFGGKRNHLFIVNVSPVIAPWKRADWIRAAVAGNVTHLPVCRLTEGPFDVEGYDWAPAGTWMVFTANSKPDADDTMHRHLYRIPVNVPESTTHGMLPVTDVSPLFDTPCLAAQPKFSPNGEFIAFYGSSRTHALYSQSEIWLYHCASGEVQNLTGEYDGIFSDIVLTDTQSKAAPGLVWSEHSRYVYSVASRQGTTQLVRIHCRTRELDWLTSGQHCMYTYSLNRRTSTAAVVKSTPTEPGNVFLLDLPVSKAETASPRRLTHWNQDWLSEVELSVPQRFSFTSEDLPMDGWAMMPADTGEGPVPAVLQIDGGPMAMYGDSFFFEFQLIAASNMAVIYRNPRGSLGYGQDFHRSIQGDWWHLDFQDSECCMDAALQKFRIDPNRLAIAIASYCGFMAAWAMGHTERYKAAVVSQQDLRCPMEQAEQLYAALRTPGVQVEFVRFPNESHGESRPGQPWHRVVRLEKIQSFLTKELMDDLSSTLRS